MNFIREGLWKVCKKSFFSFYFSKLPKFLFLLEYLLTHRQKLNITTLDKFLLATFWHFLWFHISYSNIMQGSIRLFLIFIRNITIIEDVWKYKILNVLPFIILIKSIIKNIKITQISQKLSILLYFYMKEN